MTAQELFNRAVPGGGDDFAEVIAVCRSLQAPFCLIGGLAINAYTSPVYTADADFVLALERLDEVIVLLEGRHYHVERFAHSVNARKQGSDLLIQFTTDPVYQSFPGLADEKEVLGTRVPVARLQDLIAGKLLAWRDEHRRPSKRAKDYADLLRIIETHPSAEQWIPADFPGGRAEGRNY